MTTPRSRQAIPPHTWTKLHGYPGWIIQHADPVATVELTGHGFKIDTPVEYSATDPQPANVTELGGRIRTIRPDGIPEEHRA